MKVEDFYKSRSKFAFQGLTPLLPVIMIFNPSIYDALIPWTKWKEHGDLKQMVVPYVEAGHPGPISTDKIDKLIYVRFEKDPNSLAAIFRKLRETAG